MEITISELHELQMTMIKKVNEFCKSNGFSFFMVGGTLLGAAKYKNFIPWDDDVDFALPRKDFEALVSSKEFKQGRYRIFSYKDRGFPFPYAKMIDTEFLDVSVLSKYWKEPAQLCVAMDIYPIDGLGNSQKKADYILKRVEKKKKIYQIVMESDKSPSLLKRSIKAVIKRVFKGSIAKSFGKSLYSCELDDSKYLTRWRSPYEKNVYAKDVWFGSETRLDFAGESLLAPKEYDMILRSVYGDYEMTPPDTAISSSRHSFDKQSIMFSKFLNRKFPKKES